MTTEDDNSRRSDENRVPLAEARAKLTFNDRQFDANLLNISQTGISFWMADDPGLAVGTVVEADIAAKSIQFEVKWIDNESERGVVLGGDQVERT